MKPEETNNESNEATWQETEQLLLKITKKLERLKKITKKPTTT